MNKGFLIVVLILILALVAVAGIKTQRLNAELAKSQTLISQLEERVASYETAKEEYAALKEGFDRTAQELEFLKKEIEEKAARVDGLMAENAALEDQISQLKSSAQQVSGEMAENVSEALPNPVQ